MELLYRALVLLCLVLHIGFLILEMFLWNTPTGHKILKMTPEMAQATQTLAFNQGLYNGFLAAGLLWGFLSQEYDTHVFFLCCILIAGLVGGYTASPTIYFVQALPAFLTLLVLVLLAYA